MRLKQGRKDAVTIFSRDPVETALIWQSKGAQVLHVVDLDGAFTGRQKNLDVILRIRKAVNLVMQVGGGIRNLVSVDNLVSAGIDRVILGTAAFDDSEFVIEVCNRFPGKILVGIDAKDGNVAIKGWQEVSEIDAKEFAHRIQTVGIGGIIYTDIARDGMLSSPNLKAIEEMVNTVNIPVIASGGISTVEDIKSLLAIKNLWGAITGQAIYTSALDLREAIRLTKQTKDS